MLFAGTGETGMVHEVSGAVVVNERGIVALGDLDVRVVVAAPLDRAHQALADVALPVVADGLGGNRGVAGFVNVRAGDVLGAEHADLVATGLLQRAVGGE